MQSELAVHACPASRSFGAGVVVGGVVDGMLVMIDVSFASKLMALTVLVSGGELLALRDFMRY